MARDVFISHAEEDSGAALALAEELRRLTVTPWTYEEDGVAGVSYLTQIDAAIHTCRVFVLIASERSVNTHQVVREVEQAHERQKVIIAARLGMTHQEFLRSNSILRMACGTAITLPADPRDLSGVARRIADAVGNSPVAAEQPLERLGPVTAPRSQEPQAWVAFVRRRGALATLLSLVAIAMIGLWLLYGTSANDVTSGATPAKPVPVVPANESTGRLDAPQVSAPSGSPPDTVRLESEQTLRGYGFYSPRGYIITDRIPFERERVLTAESTAEPGEPRIEIRLLRLSDVVPVALAEPVGTPRRRHTLNVRPTTSLHVGEAIQLYRGPNFVTAGTVLTISMQAKLSGSHGPEAHEDMLETTNLSAAGDSGAPILDRQNQVIGMLYASSPKVSLAVPIQRIMNAFPEAF